MRQEDPMTQSDQNVCPRCNAHVKIGANLGLIKPHHDPIVGTPCPTAGMDPAEAGGWVEDARRRIREMAQ
jgi:hypothetical protein